MERYAHIILEKKNVFDIKIILDYFCIYSNSNKAPSLVLDAEECIIFNKINFFEKNRFGPDNTGLKRNRFD